MSAAQRPGGRSARVRAQVLAATLDCVADQGPGGLQIEDVAARAGVNKTTIYRRWGDRAALVADALLQVSAAEVPIPDSGSLGGDLLALARSVRQAITSPRGRALIGAVAAAGDERELRDVARRFWRSRYAANDAILRKAVERGEITKAPDARRVVASVAGPIYFRAFVSRERIDEVFLRAVVDTVVAGLRSRARAS